LLGIRTPLEKRQIEDVRKILDSMGTPKEVKVGANSNPTTQKQSAPAQAPEKVELNKTPKDLLSEIDRLYNAGLHLAPIRPDVKRPSVMKWQEIPVSKDKVLKRLKETNSKRICLPFNREWQRAEAIDIDLKYVVGDKGEYYKTLCDTLESASPGLLEKFTIQITPSKGYHWIYRCDGIEGNLKIAWRPATDEELKTDKAKAYCTIETRGHGGQVLIEPSAGYKVIQGDLANIQETTPDERRLLFDVLRSFNEVEQIETATPTEQEKSPKKAIMWQDGAKYDGPDLFDRFNQENKLSDLLRADGFVIGKTDRLGRTPFKRPGTTAESSGNIVTRQGVDIGYNFSTNSGLPIEKPFTAKQYICERDFAGDYSAFSKHLRAKYGITNKPSPGKANSSYPFWVVRKVKDDGNHVFGVESAEFVEWIADKLSLYKCKTFGPDEIFVQVKDNVIAEKTRSEIKTDTKAIIRDKEIKNAVAKNHRLFSRDALEWLEYTEIKPLRDTQDSAFLYFKNCFVEVTPQGWKAHDYKNLKGKIWDKDIIQRDFTATQKTNFATSNFNNFLLRITSGETPEGWKTDTERYNSLLSAIGYLLHTYKDPTRAKAIFLVDENSRPDEHNGRTGKSLIVKAINHLRATTIEDGKTYNQRNNRFVFQSVTKATKVYAIEDVKPQFLFEGFYNVVTGQMSIEQKGRQPFIIPFEDSPKVVITTNYMPNSPRGDSDQARRLVVPLSGYFSAKRTPLDEYKQRFFNDFNQDDWNKFYCLMIEALRFFLAEGLQTAKETKTMREGKILSDTCPEFVEFMKDLELLEFHDFNGIYEDFLLFSGFNELPKRRLTRWLTRWGDYVGYKYQEKPTNNRTNKRFWYEELKDNELTEQ